MKKLKHTSSTITDEKGVTRTFEYYFIIEEIKTSGFFFENYGVSVEEPQGDSHIILGISTSLQRIEQLMDILVKHQVSPTTCHDVVFDWL